MNPIQRLWQWVKDRRVDRQAGKGQDAGKGNRSQGAPPPVGSAADSRPRLLKSDPGPRIV
jgi:hypothetical protein